MRLKLLSAEFPTIGKEAEWEVAFAMYDNYEARVFKKFYADVWPGNTECLAEKSARLLTDVAGLALVTSWDYFRAAIWAESLLDDACALNFLDQLEATEFPDQWQASRLNVEDKIRTQFSSLSEPYDEILVLDLSYYVAKAVQAKQHGELGNFESCLSAMLAAKEYRGELRGAIDLNAFHESVVAGNTGKTFAELGAAAKNSENRAMRRDVIEHYLGGRKKWASKDKAAEYIAGRIVPLTFRTVRKYLKGLPAAGE